MSRGGQSASDSGLKLNFLQKFSNFIQESITDRRHHHNNNNQSNSLGVDAGANSSIGQRLSLGKKGNITYFNNDAAGFKGNLGGGPSSNNPFKRKMRDSDGDCGFDNRQDDRMSNEDELFYRNLSSTKIKINNSKNDN